MFLKFFKYSCGGGGGVEEVFLSILIVVINFKLVNIFKENICNCIY